MTTSERGKNRRLSIGLEYRESERERPCDVEIGVDWKRVRRRRTSNADDAIAIRP